MDAMNDGVLRKGHARDARVAAERLERFARERQQQSSGLLLGREDDDEGHLVRVPVTRSTSFSARSDSISRNELLLSGPPRTSSAIAPAMKDR
jgi:hypothetical protein